MTARIILNPYAGRWRARRALPDVRRACAETGLDYDLVLTSEPGHAIRLAHEAVEAGCDPIVAAGGDGTIGEVLNGILRATDGAPPPASLGILPLGSADDLAHMLDVPQDLDAACRVVANGRKRVLDVGRVNGRYFANNSAIGLEPTVTLMQMRMTRIKGTLRYVLAALRVVRSFEPWRVRMVWDGGQYEGETVLVSVGNTRRTGGIFFMTPNAKPDDGQLDFVFATAMSRLRLLRTLPLTFSGRHTERPEVMYERATRLSVTCTPPSPVHADGEIFDRSASHFTYEILPAHLSVLV